MALDFTVDSAVARMKRTGQLPAVNAKLSNVELVQIMDEEIQSRIWPALMQVRDDYCMTWFDLEVFQGRNQFRLPPQVSSSTFVDLRFVEPSTGIDMIIPRAEEPLMQLAAVASQQGPIPFRYVLIGDVVTLQPTPTQNITLRIVYERRPSRLTLAASCDRITGVGAVPQVYLSAPSVFGLGAIVDVVPNRPPLGVLSQLADITAIDNTGPFTVDLNITDAASPAPWPYLIYGGFLCPQGETCVFPLPDAWFSAWIMSSAASMLDQYGASSAPRFREQAQDEIGRLIAFQSNRVRKQPHKIFDRGSPLRTGWFGRGGRGGSGW